MTESSDIRLNERPPRNPSQPQSRLRRESENLLRCRVRRETLEGGMPIYKYLSRRFLTIFENFSLGPNPGDFQSGFRAYTRDVLETVNYRANSDVFVFDTEFLPQAVYHGFRIGDIPLPTRYFKEASSINFRCSLKYGLQTVAVMGKFGLQSLRFGKFRIFDRQ